jgi:uncharacterized small protein (DUF1192 family)
MDEDLEPIKKVVHEVGSPLDRLSVDELGARIALLEEEIARLRQAIEAKKSSKDAADSFFKL